MTLQDWRADVTLASELKKALELPIIQKALSVCDGLTAAKTLGTSNSLITNANNAHVLFGFDAGRASILNDLKGLSIVPEEIDEIQPTYTGEF
jgi:hypothetical protein